MYCTTAYVALLLVLLTEQHLVRILPTAAATAETKNVVSGQHLLSKGNDSSIEVKPSCLHPQWPEHIVQYSNCDAKVLRCYCLTPTNSTIINSTEVQYALGHCIYGCFIANKYTEYYHEDLTNNLWNSTLCSQYSRSGTLCGRCKGEHGPAVYSFSLRCVECHDVVFWKRLLLYILIAYGPLTVFLVIIVFFTVSVKSAPLHGWIFVSQIITCPFYMRTVTRVAELHHIDQYSYKIITSFYGIWNLDFFKTVYSPFCLHPNLTTLQVLSLDYIIAAYPLVAILLMYVLVDMYSRNYRPVVVMWRPFHYCCIRFRHQLNIKTPLINAFGTFFWLSYVKIFNTAIDLLTPTKVWNESGKVSYHAYFDGTQLMFQDGHLPFALLSVLILIIFNFLPLILLLIYAFPKTQFCIPSSLQNVLYPFMDDILSCYKDGHNGTSNCRYFAVIYPIARMIILSSIMWTESMFFYPCAAAVIIVCGILVTLIRPYKSALYNALDTLHLLCLAVALVGNVAFFIAYVEDLQNIRVSYAMVLFPAFVHVSYIIFYLGWKCWPVLKHPLVFIVKPVFKLVLPDHQMTGVIEDTAEVSESSRLLY